MPIETGTDLVESLREFPVAVLCNADDHVSALGPCLQPLFRGARVFGLARTVQIEPGQNAAIHRAVASAQRGEVLVVATGGDRAHGPFGDILAQACIDRGIAGLVIDGAIRDCADIAALGFPVFCNGANPTGTSKSAPGFTDISVVCGQAMVRPGDLVSGDADGVVVVPGNLLNDMPPRARAVVERERQIRQQLAEGKSTCEIFSIEI